MGLVQTSVYLIELLGDAQGARFGRFREVTYSLVVFFCLEFYFCYLCPGSSPFCYSKLWRKSCWITECFAIRVKQVSELKKKVIKQFLFDFRKIIQQAVLQSNFPFSQEASCWNRTRGDFRLWFWPVHMAPPCGNLAHIALHCEFIMLSRVNTPVCP